MIFNTYTEQAAEVCGITFVSCGHIFAKPGREINRPKGREDWLLFYVAKETETFYLDQTVTAPAGSFILFAPGEKQHHIYSGTKTAEFYYIHFKCDSLPSDFSLKTSCVYELPFQRKVCDVFEEIIDETLKKHPFYEKICLYKTLLLLTDFNRSVLHINHPAKDSFDRIALVVQHMNISYYDNLTLQDYAEMCGFSKYHFIRVFEQLTGISPLEYRNQIRLEHAAEMLCNEKKTVEEIGNQVGFSSASYFSSAFKKKYEISPKQYQKQNKNYT